MLKRLLIAIPFLYLAICTAHADDKLDAAMKRIAELEAKNHALEQSNKEKDALLKKQRIKISARANKTTAQSTLLSSTPSSLPSSATKRSDDNVRPSIAGVYIGIDGGFGGGDFDYRSLGTYAGKFWLRGVHNVYRAGGAVGGGQIGYNYTHQVDILLAESLILIG